MLKCFMVLFAHILRFLSWTEVIQCMWMNSVCDTQTVEIYACKYIFQFIIFQTVSRPLWDIKLSLSFLARMSLFVAKHFQVCELIGNGTLVLIFFLCIFQCSQYCRPKYNYNFIFFGQTIKSSQSSSSKQFISEKRSVQINFLSVYQ